MNSILKRKKAICIVSIAIAIIAVLFTLVAKNVNNKSTKLDIETMRAMNYEQLTEEQEYVENCSNNIKFSAFFTKDLNGDGIAEKILGSCREIGYFDTLYIDINVLEEGYLKDGIIKINSNNFTYTMQMVKDTVLKNNYVSSNVKNIELNDVYAGTQKLIMGTTRAQIEDENSYTANNTVTLEGIYVDNEGKETPISKTIDLTLDWYGEAKAELKSKTVEYTVKELFGEDNNQNPTFNFSFTMSETRRQLLTNEQDIEVTLPALYGYYPTYVRVNSPGIISSYYSYDEESHIVSIKNVTNTNNTEYEISVVYPDEAYDKLKEPTEDFETVNLIASVSGYIKCHNNTNEEFENPYNTNTATTIASIAISRGEVKAPSHEFNLAFWGKTYMGNNEYVMSKQSLLDAYDTEDEIENMEYTVRWGVSRQRGDTLPTTIVMKDTYQGGDRFDLYDLSDYVSNVGVYFEGGSLLIPDDGYVRIYNDDTNELIKEFKNGEWKTIQRGNMYYYDVPVKHIRVETSEDQIVDSSFVMYNVKELDVSKLKQNFTREDIENIEHFTTPIFAYGSNIDNETNGRDSVDMVTAKSYNKISLSQTTISTSETNPVKENITIDVPQSNPAYADWQNGVFLVEIPSKIIYTKVNNVTASNESVSIEGYEVYQKDGKYFIKIVTSSSEPTSNFKIEIDCDMLADPMSLATLQAVTLYSYNEYCDMYYNTANDVHDLDGDESVSDVTGVETAELSISAPSTFVTVQTVSNYNNEGEVTVAPNIAEVTKDTREATINIELANNYASAISNVEILGKVPFEGNTYISGTPLNSEYTVTMKDGGITVPQELQEITAIYYSEQENPSRDLEDANNGWKISGEVTSFENIKTYLIAINSDYIGSGKTYKFSYTVTIPENITANLVTYACHAVYFNLNTEGGKLPTSVTPNKVGIRITRYYDMEIMKYKEGETLGIQGAKYQLSWKEDEETTEHKIATSTSEGVLKLSNLRANQIYTLKEITAPKDYELNEETIKFKVVENESKQLEVVVLEGAFGAEPTIDQDENGKDVLKSCVYDSPKFLINITKIDSKTEEKLTGVIFEIDGKPYVTKNGNVQITGLSIGKTYTLKEKYAKGYYLNGDIEFSIQKNSDGEIYLQGNSQAFENINIRNPKETDSIEVDLTIKNEKIPTYNLHIEKIDENNVENKLSNARFLLSKEDIGSSEYYTTDENGNINISELYQYVQGKNITGRYTLQEETAPSGYILNNEQISFVVGKNEEGKLEATIENAENLNIVYDVIVEDEENVKLVLQNKPFFKTTKIDEETKAPLANVEFIIYELDREAGTILDYAKDVNGEYVGTQNANGDYVIITDENGVITAPLGNGVYKIIEATYPEGYEEKQNIEVFEINGNKDSKEKEELEIPAVEMEDNTTEVLEISYIEDLVDLQRAVNNNESTYADTTVKLTRSLDFNSDDSYRNPGDTSYGDERGIKTQLTDRNGEGFTPIGTYKYENGEVTTSFEGIFDGDGHVIENIYINHDSYTGLFGYSKVLRVKNLGITGTITGNEKIGGLCGHVEDYAYVENCYSECNINTNTDNGSYIGGLIGCVQARSNTFIKNSYNIGSSVSGHNEVGGIIGQIGESNPKEVGDVYIVGCYNTAYIEGTNYTGGIIGNLDSEKNVYIKDCYNTGLIRGVGDSFETGGIVGNMDDGVGSSHIYDCYNTGDIICDNNKRLLCRWNSW